MMIYNDDRIFMYIIEIWRYIFHDADVILPEKKQVSSPNRGLYMAHLGDVNSTISVNILIIRGIPYPDVICINNLSFFFGLYQSL